MKKKSAFTLIELLVVVAIIAILAALLFPSLRAFLEKGRATDCANNLGSLGKVMQQYTMDQKGTFFAADASGEDTWPKILYRNYTSKDWRPFRSPFDKPTDQRPKNKTEDPVPVSYGVNEKLFDTFEGKWKSPRSSLIMAAPALDLSYDGKEIRFKQDAFSTSNVKLLMGTGQGKLGEKGHGTHEERQKLNVLFADGHVGPMDIHKYEDGTTEKGKQQWDPFYEAPETP
jgi:prepilin-type N-terminal cleavage/methylation domain-containing protein/prepilin-type processing-associated H-X9-DG protein